MLRILICFAVLLMFTIALKSQVQYEMSVSSIELVNENNLEFEVHIKSLSGSFELTSYQCAFTFNKTIINGGELNLFYINGSSQLNNIPTASVGIKTDQISDELTFASMPGSDMITTASKRVGRFQLQNTNSFSISSEYISNLTWDFDGWITTIVTGTGFADITNSNNHIIKLKSFDKLNIIQAIGADTINSSQHPGKTKDGLGFYDGDVNSKWISGSAPKWIIFDLGYKVSVNLTRFSFYNFNLGRGYEYSVQISDDMLNWQNVLSNAMSSLKEWTDGTFDPVGARYVKLIMHTSPNQFTGLWEVEIWSNDLTALPVELSNFSLKQVGKHVQLTWQTTSEIMNYGFEVQRSVNQTEWNTLGFVNGYGNSNIPRNYEFLDDSVPLEGTYFYRLKQIDTDGTFEYSHILEIYVNSLPKEISLSQNYPNPFNPSTTIVFNLPSDEAKVNLTIYNIVGEKVADVISGELLNAGSHEIVFDGSNLASGIYFYSLQTENFSESKKMMLMK